MRSRPGGIAFVCMVIAVPLIIGAAMVTIYLEHRVAISVQSRQLTRLRQATMALVPALEAQRLLQTRRALGIDLLADVKSTLPERTQWSPVLTTVIDCLPGGLILTRLGAARETARREVPVPDDPETTMEINVPIRTLQIRVAGHDEETAHRAVREFQDRLRSSADLGTRIDMLTVSQESEILDGEPAVSYELNCTFRPSW